MQAFWKQEEKSALMVTPWEGLAGIAKQGLHQVPLPVGEGALPRRTAQNALGRVEGHPAQAEPGGALPAPGPPAHGPDAGDQLLHGEGLDQIVVRPGLQPLHPVGHRVQGGDNQHGGGNAVGAHPAEDGGAAHGGKHPVQDDEVVGLLADPAQAVVPVAAHVHGEALPLQLVAHRLAQLSVVLYH